MADNTSPIPGTDTSAAADAARQELLDRLLVERFTSYPSPRVRTASRASEPSRAGSGTAAARRAR